jgi:hypothetical protein
MNAQEFRRRAAAHRRQAATADHPEIEEAFKAVAAWYDEAARYLALRTARSPGLQPGR